MTDQPNASELLREARETLLREILPHLGEAQKYPALMIANAMAIATREIGDTGRVEREMTNLLLSLYESNLPDADNGRADRLQRLERRLAKDIREGRLDQQASSLRAALLEHVRARLRISNPKYLARAEQSQLSAGTAED